MVNIFRAPYTHAKVLWNGFHTNNQGPREGLIYTIPEESLTREKRGCLFSIIGTGHQDLFGNFPTFSLQSSFTIPVAPVILHTFNLGAFGIVTFKDDSTISIL